MTQIRDMRRLADRLDIQDVIYRWCRGVDRRDWGLVRSVFHPDAHDDHGLFKGGVEEMLSWLQQRHAAVSQSMHHAGNILIEFTGEDQALVETYVLGLQRYPDGDRAARIAILGEEAGSQSGELDMILPGRYVDVVERRAGEWRIKSRTVVFESISARVVGEFPKVNDQWRRAQRDQSDTIFRKFAELKASAAP